MVRLKKMNGSTSVRVGPQGRIVIPANIRRSLSIKPGEELLIRVEDGRLVLESRAQVLERVQSWFAKIPKEVNLADELIAQRREEIRKEIH
jgi:AbrB family looped-hinge helix DNA binding protein